MAAFTFRKEERLKRKKQIDQLFASGRTFFIHPFKVFWRVSEAEEPYPARVLIGVSRRSMKKAVQRNRTKRMIREAYRYQKAMLYQGLEKRKKHIHIGIIYTGHELLPFEDIKGKINGVMARLLKEINRASP